MVKQKFCEECGQKRECQGVYQRLGKSEGPSVVFKVVLAFLLPLVVFIGSLAAFKWILAKAIDSEEVQTVVSFVLALLVAFALILIIKVINRRLSKNR
jgi:uncharacterized Tic20 family protein